jgi:uncharacterized membrane protein YvbJ
MSENHTVCPYCGEKINEADRICANCGHELDTVKDNERKEFPNSEKISQHSPSINKAYVIVSLIIVGILVIGYLMT